ncbi:serine hydrolase domain-containing protein [Teredinibacter turnerae]|uniref:serine hydrolase domain-containing protein n=1 Tax=Teredinibacter turnerae TaxID=2426 RepID=UPI0003603C61|nr:serine hydrolase domain-containing protein [Teredinibacter turnerae]
MYGNAKTIATTLSVFFISFSLGCFAQNDAERSSQESLSRFIDAVNSNNPAAQKDYIRAHYLPGFLEVYPVEMHYATLSRLFAEQGKLERPSFSQPEFSDNVFHASAVVHSDKTELWIEITLYFANKHPTQITGVRVRNADFKSVPIRTKINTNRQLKREIRSLTKRLEDKGLFSGTILIANGSKALFVDSVGFSNKRYKIKNTRTTKYNLGSMNKMFTAVALMQLIEQGKISLDDTIEKFIDSSWLAPEIAQNIKVKHLLSHTSGLGSYFNEAYENSPKDHYRSIEDYKPLVRSETLKFNPGTKFHYSNTGMLLAGVLVEKISGQNYFDYVQQHVYAPAQMVNSASFELDDPIPNLATGYFPNPMDKTQWKENTYRVGVKGGPAGGGYATVDDLHQFAQALLANQLLSEANTEELFKVHDNLGAHGYGFGFEVEDTTETTIVGHSGRFDGISANLDIFTKNGYIVVLLSNQSAGIAPLRQVTRALIHRLGTPQ